MTPVYQIRDNILHFLYGKVAKPIFFLNDPEVVHDRMTRIGSFLGSYRPTRALTSLFFNYENPRLEQKILGIRFTNPIGLAAGFDKNAELTGIMPSVGFGFEEIGSVTGYACGGNPKPRLWRLKKSKGLVVHFGLKNDGADVVASRLKKLSFTNRIGTSVAMTNCKDNLDTHKAVLDYAKAFKAFVDIGDYFTINISCPNALGGQPFVAPYRLDYLLDIIDEVKTRKPVFLKISPDISQYDLDSILDVAEKHRVHGIICTNLTKKKDNPKIIDENLPNVGGVSGKPVQELSDKMLSYVYKTRKNKFVIIGLGGVFNAEDAYKKIRLGASLVQMITGMIFEGPQVVSEINRGLIRLLDRDGFKNISEAVGVDSAL